jgi:hypothetical protein
MIPITQSMSPIACVRRRSSEACDRFEYALIDALWGNNPRFFRLQETVAGITEELASWIFSRGPLVLSLRLSKKWHPFAVLPFEPPLVVRVEIEEVRFHVKLLGLYANRGASAFDFIDDSWTYRDLATAISDAVKSPKMAAALEAARARWRALALPSIRRPSAITGIAHKLGSEGEAGLGSEDLETWFKKLSHAEGSEHQWWQALRTLASDPGRIDSLATVAKLVDACDADELRLALELALLAGPRPGQPTRTTIATIYHERRSDEEVGRIRRGLADQLRVGDQDAPDALCRLTRRLMFAVAVTPPGVPPEQCQPKSLDVTRSRQGIPRVKRTQDVVSGVAEMGTLYEWSPQQESAVLGAIEELEEGGAHARGLVDAGRLAEAGAKPEEIALLIRAWESLRHDEHWQQPYEILLAFLRAEYPDTIPEWEEVVAGVGDVLLESDTGLSSRGHWLKERYCGPG